MTNEFDKNNTTKSTRVVIKDFPYEESAKLILDILKDGQFHSTLGIPDDERFASLVAVHEDEISDLINEDGSPDIKARERYAYKKRRLFLDQFIALKLLGMVEQKNKTSSAEYGLTPYGVKILQGLQAVGEAEKIGMDFNQLLRNIT